MGLENFAWLRHLADEARAAVPVVAAGGDEPSVLEALATARDRGWAEPIVVGPEGATRAAAEACGRRIEGFRLIDAKPEDVAEVAVAEVRLGRARLLMKGRIATPRLLRAVLDPAAGLRAGRTVCQVVLMDVDPPGRQFLLADTGICVAPDLRRKVEIMTSAVAVAHALGAERPRVALMAATEAVNPAMPETVHAAELERRNLDGEFPGCTIQGPLSFDLAYAPLAARAKQVGGAVTGAADVMIFPNLVSANLTVKAIMYTAPCAFGGVLRGTTVPVAFMSRADTPETRLNSLALAMRLLDG